MDGNLFVRKNLCTEMRFGIVDTVKYIFIILTGVLTVVWSFFNGNQL